MTELTSSDRTAFSFGWGWSNRYYEHTQINTSALCLARTEVTFSIAAPGVASLGFVAKIIDNTPVFWLVEQCLHSVTAFLFLTMLTTPMSNWERTQMGQLT